MARDLTGWQQSLLDSKVHSMATLWEIIRTDGVVLRFTDHDSAIEFEGELFGPAGGFNATARQLLSDLQTSNHELAGMILDDSKITHADMLAERYFEAQIIERLVNHRHPWTGSLTESHYWIVETTFSKERWEATAEGLSRWITPKVGRLFTKTCRHTLGDAICQVDLAATKESGTIFELDADPEFLRVRFTANGLTAGSGAFTFGKLTFTSGALINISAQVKLYELGAPSTIELVLPTAVPFAVNDTFDIEAGCDKLIPTCDVKFNNSDNFGGFPFLPGEDKTFQIPERK